MDGKSLIGRISAKMEIPAVPMTGSALIEIAGDRRVLIENHRGIVSYDHCRIVVRVPSGCVCVMGSGLCVVMMDRAQLIIGGKIKNVSLAERDGAL